MRELVRDWVGPEDSDEVELVVEEEREGRQSVNIPLFNWDFKFGDLDKKRSVPDEYSKRDQEEKHSQEDGVYGEWTFDGFSVQVEVISGSHCWVHLEVHWPEELVLAGQFRFNCQENPIFFEGADPANALEGSIEEKLVCPNLISFSFVLCLPEQEPQVFSEGGNSGILSVGIGC